jgi:hypothetical protein
MIIVAPPRPHFAQPWAIFAGLIAKNLFDGGMDKDALNLRMGCRTLDQPGVRWRPKIEIYVEGVSEHRDSCHLLPLLMIK